MIVDSAALTYQPPLNLCSNGGSHCRQTCTIGFERGHSSCSGISRPGGRKAKPNGSSRRAWREVCNLGYAAAASTSGRSGETAIATYSRLAGDRWKGLKGVRAGRVGGTDRAPNHIDLSRGEGRVRGFLQCTHSIASRNPHHPVESSSRFVGSRDALSTVSLHQSGAP